MPGGRVCVSASRSYSYVSTTVPRRISPHVKVPSGHAHCRGSVQRPRESLLA